MAVTKNLEYIQKFPQEVTRIINRQENTMLHIGQELTIAGGAGGYCLLFTVPTGKEFYLTEINIGATVNDGFCSFFDNKLGDGSGTQIGYIGCPILGVDNNNSMKYAVPYKVTNGVTISIPMADVQAVFVHIYGIIVG